MSTKDSDNKLVMAAFAVVDVENAAGYAYLFREAKKNPDMAAFLNSPDTTIYADGHLGRMDVHAVQVGRCAVWQRQVRDEGADECRMARQPRGTDVRVAVNSGQNQLHLQVPC